MKLMINEFQAIDTHTVVLLAENLNIFVGMRVSLYAIHAVIVDREIMVYI